MVHKEYRFLNGDLKPKVILPSVVIEEHDDVLDILYSADSVSGYPSNDLAVLVQKGSAPELVTYVQTRPRMQRGVLSYDKDLALHSIPNKGENIVQYADRMKSYLASIQKSDV